MGIFVENTAERLTQIYQTLWNGHAALPEGTTALELMIRN
jgi:hypothetical protein